MADKNFTLVLYYVPEDQDDPDIPNAFGIKKAAEELRLSDVQAHFPLEGTYHFRFKYRHATEYVWLDLVNPNCKLPMVDGKIFMKATRRSWTNDPVLVAPRATEEKIRKENVMPEIIKVTPKKVSLLEGLDSPPLTTSVPPFKLETKNVRNSVRANIGNKNGTRHAGSSGD